MGAPKKIRKKYETPSMMWDSARIQREHELKAKYGLKNLRELWILDSELRRIKQNVRSVLSGRSSEQTGKDIIARLSRYNIVKNDATPDDLLVINVEALLERRLQTIVLRKGLAKTSPQARQLIAHGIISINGKRVTSPGHLVLASEEAGIAYYKPFKIQQPEQPVQVAAVAARASATTAPAAEQAQAEAPAPSAEAGGSAKKGEA
ncbi:MAG: 30S ribosomal protein S4 [Candidatus Marsarchaeota archaeon]|nr:30S ribosomal protein S4 [Candidatus Marsarchaeota archaeon]